MQVSDELMLLPVFRAVSKAVAPPASRYDHSILDDKGLCS